MKEHCPYGTNCHFAHGRCDKKELQRKPIRYKTEKCA